MKVVIVGTGGISYRHAEACQALEGVELVALCDTRPEAAARLADQFGVTARYGDVDELIARERTDLAIVAVWGAVPRGVLA